VSLHRASEAIAPLKRALDIRQKNDPAHLGETEFALARALWDSRRDPSQALSLAQAAVIHYGKQPTATAARAKAAEWLSRRKAEQKALPVGRID
jgi:hypothetical protein